MMTKKRNRIRRAAGRAPTWIRRIAGEKNHTAAMKAYSTRQLGKFGPASDVRHIDPQTWLITRAKRDLES